jgi:Zn-dependent protease with chaperone function
MRAFLRTTALFLMLTLVFALLGVLIGYFFTDIWLGVLIMIIFAVIINLYAFVFSKKTVLRRHKVKIITEAQNPRLYNIVKNISEKAGLPMPQVGITNNPSPNAFATGRGPKDAAVVATSGLLTLLNDEELAGVMAHELAHVKNRDVMIMSIAATVGGVIAFIGSRLWILAFMSGGNNKNGAAMIAAAIVGAITFPLAAMLIQMSISRGREFGADRTGAMFTGNPMALASALRKLEGGIAHAPMSNTRNNDGLADAHLWIEPPAAKSGGVSSLFSTHPKTADRVARLEAMVAGVPVTAENNPFV